MKLLQLIDLCWNCILWPQLFLVHLHFIANYWQLFDEQQCGCINLYIIIHFIGIRANNWCGSSHPVNKSISNRIMVQFTNCFGILDRKSFVCVNILFNKCDWNECFSWCYPFILDSNECLEFLLWAIQTKSSFDGISCKCYIQLSMLRCDTLSIVVQTINWQLTKSHLAQMNFLFFFSLSDGS